MSRLVSSVYARAAINPMTSAEQDEAARSAWHAGSDMVALRLSAIRNDWTRQEIINEANRQHGCRPKRKAPG